MLEEDVSHLTIYEQIVQYPPEGWEELFKSCHKIFENISKITEKYGEYYPSPNDLFRVFRMCRPEEIKCVIFGQDPYPTKGDACGLAFSTRGKIPPSLRVIFKELQNQYNDFDIPDTGDLTPWVEQGVFLLNTCLTYFPEHKLDKRQRSYWIPFTMKVIEFICSENTDVIFVMWGKDAQEYEFKMKGHTKLTAPHPSPLARGGFLGCGHFALINEYLDEIGKDKIDWRLKEEDDV